MSDDCSKPPSEPSADDLRAGCDAIEADMAKHQRMFARGGEVTANANHELATRTFEQLEQQWAEERNPHHRTPPSSSSPAPAPITRTETTATIEDRTYKVVREADDTKFRKANPQEQWFVERAWPRIELLLTKQELGSYGDGFIAGTPACRYSWKDRVLAACRFQQIDKQRFLAELVQVLEDSCHHFGDWKSDPPSKVSASG